MAKTDKETKGVKKHFWKDFKAELKKVIWPTPKQIVNNTATVIGIVLITVVIVFILDVAFDALNTYGINKLRTLVDNTTTSEVENTDINSENENAQTDTTDADNTDTSNNVDEQSVENQNEVQE